MADAQFGIVRPKKEHGAGGSVLGLSTQTCPADGVIPAMKQIRPVRRTSEVETFVKQAAPGESMELDHPTLPIMVFRKE